MSDVELICKKSFSDVDSEILERFIEFQQALIDKDAEKLDEILTEKYELVHMSGKRQTKQEFISEIMDGTLNYYKSEMNVDGDNPPIGIVLGADADKLTMQYAMDGISNQLFAAKYQLYLPSREDLQNQLDRIMNNNLKNDRDKE